MRNEWYFQKLGKQISFHYDDTISSYQMFFLLYIIHKTKELPNFAPRFELILFLLKQRNKTYTYEVHNSSPRF